MADGRPIVPQSHAWAPTFRPVVERLKMRLVAQKTGLIKKQTDGIHSRRCGEDRNNSPASESHAVSRFG
jgi:hypothetical protein